MRTRRRNQNEFNALHVFLGLLLGFFLGGSVVYWHSSRQTNKLFSETLDKVVALFSETPTPAPDPSESPARRISRRPAGSAPGTTPHTTESIALEDNSEEVSMEVEPAPDPVTTEEPEQPAQGIQQAENQTSFPTPYTMANDRLLHTKTVSVTLPAARLTDAQKRLDSLVDNTQPQRNEQIFFIEFWESPLNSLVYRMGKNKIVFYGIRLFDMAAIYHHQGKFYLRYLNHHYPLEYTTHFKPLIPISSPVLPEDIQDI